MQVSIDNNFKTNLAPFAFYPRIAEAPYFSWEMVMLDWMHDADMGVVPAELGEIWRPYSCYYHIHLDQRAQTPPRPSPSP